MREVEVSAVFSPVERHKGTLFVIAERVRLNLEIERTIVWLVACLLPLHPGLQVVNANLSSGLYAHCLALLCLLRSDVSCRLAHDLTSLDTDLHFHMDPISLPSRGGLMYA